MILVHHISRSRLLFFGITLLFFLCDFFFLETCFKTKIWSETWFVIFSNQNLVFETGVCAPEFVCFSARDERYLSPKNSFVIYEYSFVFFETEEFCP